MFHDFKKRVNYPTAASCGVLNPNGNNMQKYKIPTSQYQLMENKTNWNGRFEAITPFIKYLAIMLFIVLLFIVFWISVGYLNKEENALIERDAPASNNQPIEVYSEKITLCETIQIEVSKDQCYLDYAQSRKDITLCEYIKNQEKQKQCKEYLNLEEPPITIYTLSSYPSAIAVGEKKKIMFTVSQAGTLEKAAVHVEQINEKGDVIHIVGMLNDEGKDGDLRANDFVYGGEFTVGSYNTEQSIHYHAIFVFSNNVIQPIKTDEYLFSVTNFPLDSPPFDPSKVVDNPRTGEQMISNEVLVGFNEGVTPDRIREIVKEIDGEVINVIFGLNSYRIKISDTGNAAEVYRIIKILEKFSEVEYAEPNGVTSIDTP